MAFLAPAAAGAAGTVGATAGAAALAKGAALAGGASSALGAGLTAGTALGGGAMAAMPALSYAGANLAAPGILGALPSAIAPTAGIFAKAAPALAGLPSAVAPTAGIFSKAAPALGGLSSMTPTAASGFKSLAMANAPLTAPSSFGAVNQAVGLGDVAAKTTSLTPELTKASYLTRGAGPSVPSIETRQFADLASGAQTGGLKMPTPGAETTGLRLSPEVAQSVMTPRGSPILESGNFLSNFGNLLQNPSLDAAGDYLKKHPGASMAAGYGLYSLMKPEYKAPPKDKALIRPYEFTQTQRPEAYAESPLSDTSERMYFDTSMTAKAPYEAPGPEYAADGGLMGYAVGGPVEQMAAMNAVGANTGYPMAGINTAMYSNPMVQRPEAVNVISPSGDAGVSAYSGEPKFAEGGDTKDKEPPYAYTYDPKTLQFTQTKGPKVGSTLGGIGALVGSQGAAPPAATSTYPALSIPAYQTPEQRLGLADFYAMMDRRLGQMGGYAAGGGISDLGAYSDGGRLLRGPGDGVSDSIPAVIGDKQPARLADGEFVIPARIVSELGNGSTEAGARKLYAMMDRVQKARRKTVGKNKVAANTRADKHLPA